MTLNKENLSNLSNTKIVEIVYKNHHVWISQVAYNFTQNSIDAEDLVQELYVFLMEMNDINKIRFNDTVNLFYIYKILKSKFLNGKKKSSKINILPIEEDYLDLEDTVYNVEKDMEFEKMLSITNHLLEDNVHWYDSKLLQTYVNEGHSIASLHKATGISKSSIWTTIDKTRKYIKYSYEQTRNENNLIAYQRTGSCNILQCSGSF